ncbi:MAG: ATP-binding cassette domain-containing protein [Clostridiales Family XIII bacterium]|jgi:putative multiple sugar transport system ATP-binding protein|nr:ATP-binding cassette domain-containing protein [Clostridiales Family XIII bacterium]
MEKYLLEMRSITKRFPGVKALDNVNLQVERGEIHALVGENGAGKSTLMNVLSGIYPYGTYEGDIILEGEVVQFGGIKESEKRGIVIIHQELALIPQLTIGENIFLGNERGKAAAIDWDETYARADELLATVGLSESSRININDISVGKQQLVEIAKALSKNVSLLILDEPTASLNDDDSNKLLNLLLQLKEGGLTSILISHKLSEVERVADHLTVLRDGSTIETLNREEINEQRIIRSMVGRELTDRFPARVPHIGDVTLEVKDWTSYHPKFDRKLVDGASFNVRKGEVVGISGLMGAGRSELAMSIFGRLYGRNISGSLLLNGEEVTLKNVPAAIKSKLAYVTEDRKTSGLVLSNPIRVNITLADLARVSKRGFIDAEEELTLSEEYSAMLNVKASDVEQKVENLSGGNQQKVLLAKWLFTEPEILILDEPTRGIDVGAKYEIYLFINELVAQGKSVIMISSEMPELLGMCDRIYVMNEGRIVAEFMKGEATQERIMESILRTKREVADA